LLTLPKICGTAAIVFEESLVSQIRRNEYEAARQDQPAKGKSEEKWCQKEPAEIEGAKQVFLLINGI
jgi:hypothetical protein